VRRQKTDERSRRRDLARQRTHELDAGLGDDLADEGEADVDLAFRQRRHGARTTLRTGDLWFHLLGNAEPSERLVEADTSSGAGGAVRVGDALGREQHPLHGVRCRDVGLPIAGADRHANSHRGQRRGRVGDDVAGREDVGIRRLHDRDVERFAGDDLTFGAEAGAEGGDDLMPRFLLELRNQLHDRGANAARRDERDLVGLNGRRADQDQEEGGCLHPFHSTRLSYTPARKDAPPNRISRTDRTFSVGNTAVRTSSSTKYEHVTCNTLANNMKIEAEGRFANGVLNATKIEKD
jgi:hypothetical protein